MMSEQFSVQRFNKVGNFFLVSGSGGLTLIDTGARDRLENIRAKFERAGHRLEDLDRIIPTHCHFDHVGSLDLLRQSTGALVLAHEAEAPIIAGKKKLPRPRGPAGVLHTLTEPLFRPRPCEVDGRLKDGDQVEHTSLMVIHTPGHTPGSICLYHSETRSLFTGDAFVNLGGKVRGPVAPFCSDVRLARRSLTRLAKLEVKIIYFAHGRTVREGAQEAILSVQSD